MHFVYDHVGERSEKARPLFMVGQQGKVQHLRVGEQHRGRGIADFAAKMVCGVTVVDGGSGARIAGPVGCQGVEGRQLVLCEGLQGKEVDGACVWVAQKLFQHGQVVDEGLAAGCGGRHHDIPSGTDDVGGAGLMAVQVGDALPREDVLHGARPGAVLRCGLCLALGDDPVMAHLPPEGA